MRLKNFTILICLLLAKITVQAQTIQFTSITKAATEDSGTILVFAKIQPTATATATFDVVRRSGDARDVSNFYTSSFTINIGEDSVAIPITIADDCYIENPESFQFVLRGNNIGADSIFTLQITDNDLPITIGFEKASDTVIEYAGTHRFAVVVNNPNDHPVCYWSQSIPALTTAWGGACCDYGYDWEWHSVPPGISRDSSHVVTIFNDMAIEPWEYIYLSIPQDSIGASTITTPVMILWIEDDDIYIPGTINFKPIFNYTLWEDTIGVLPVVVERNNPNFNPMNYRVEQDLVNNTVQPNDFIFYPDYKSAPMGLTYDTMFVRIINDTKVENIEVLYIKIRQFGVNIVTDSVFSITVIDKDTVQTGFKGAGYSYLESSGRIGIPLVTNSEVPYPINAKIRLAASNAVNGADFLFNDTTIVFPANSIDTQYVFVTILEDNYFEGNEQINLYIDSLSPSSSTHLGIRQFTVFIIDNDDNVGLADLEKIGMSIYPNPVSHLLQIESKETLQTITVKSILGETVMTTNNSHTIDVAALPDGFYLLQIATANGVICTKFLKRN